MFALQFLAATAIVIAFCSLLWWLNKDDDEEKPEQPSIDIVREAAFAVIEASLQNEPEKWKIKWSRDTKKRPEYITNEEVGTSIWLYGGPGKVFVVHTELRKGQAFPRQTQITPSAEMQARLFTAAMKIANKISEDREIASLEKMVDAFWKTSGRIDHDQKTA